MTRGSKRRPRRSQKWRGLQHELAVRGRRVEGGGVALGVEAVARAAGLSSWERL